MTRESAIITPERRAPEGAAPAVRLRCASPDASPANGGGAASLTRLPSPACHALRTRIIAEARSWLATPYVHQASAKGAGTDCLGLVRGVWRALYGTEPEAPPPYTPDWSERYWLAGARAEPLLDAARRNMREAPRESMTPGDVLVFRVMRDGPAKHCGVLVAEGRFIHAYAGRGVVESWLTRWWLERLAGVFVFPEPRL